MSQQRFQPQYTVLLGDGIISVDAGQYVYIYCSVNEFTAEAADENAKLNITVK
ncbi:MAG: hypothetical protein IJF50_11130 [Peptococcaceae bacterium]|nr:hypothetical protein [Peptococcaceae bacterium]MBQ2905240.1 hypothetical protein [Peptococcaceae bacterium]